MQRKIKELSFSSNFAANINWGSGVLLFVGEL